MTSLGHSPGVESLTREDCLALLSGADLARVVLSVRALPVALPARIALTNDDHLLLASNEEAVVLAARRGDVISVQIDGLEPDGSTWSVMVSGIATFADGTAEVRSSLRRAVDNGATLYAMPLSVLSGQRSR
jgi:uncharacterized protein